MPSASDIQPVLVVKFGGTSVGSPEGFSKVLDILQDAWTSRTGLVAVTSALSGVTDALLRQAGLAAGGQTGDLETSAEQLLERHAQIAQEFVPDDDLRAGTMHTIEALLADFTGLCRAIAILGEASPRARDAVASLGERMAAPLVAAACQARGLPAQALDAMGLIISDDHFQDATPLWEETRSAVRARLRPLIEARELPVVTGFCASTAQGVVTTLGRGGSDYSAAILAAALPAGEVCIWTDVDGVMSADPRLVSEAHTIPELSFREVAELAYYGAKVLQPKSIRPVVDAGIRLSVRNTFRPEGAGTRIVSGNHAVDDGVIKAVTAFGGHRLITVEGRGMLGVPGVAARTFASVAATGTSVPLISQASSEQSICFAVPADAAERVLASLHRGFQVELARGDIDRIWAGEEIAILTVVGEGMRSTPGVAGRVFGALGNEGVNVIAIAQGASEVSISMIVDATDMGRAVRALHALIHH